MANVLGSSTSNAGMQAPPPPPLPAGMSMVQQNGAEKQAPPPPPLPAGMSIVSQNGAGRQAPPPPPLPAGLHAIGATTVNQNAGMQAPPPPPLPNGMVQVGQQNAFRQADGRPKMSLADAMNASRQENVELPIAPKEPVAAVNGGNLSVGDCCFARSGMDGLYYHAHIDAIDDTGADLTFFDESQEHVIFSKMYTIEKIPQAMQCFANWNNNGSYYPAKVVDFPENSYTVVYDENPDIKDTLGCERTRFAPW